MARLPERYAQKGKLACYVRQYKIIKSLPKISYCIYKALANLETASARIKEEVEISQVLPLREEKR